MIVVSDTSPILNLSIVGRLELLRSLFGEIVLPPWVAAELGRHQIEVEASWMRVVSAQDRAQLAELRQQLDPGEAEAIIVALELQASLILIDEQRGPSRCGGSGSGIHGTARRILGSEGARSYIRMQADA